MRLQGLQPERQTYGSLGILSAQQQEGSDVHHEYTRRTTRRSAGVDGESSDANGNVVMQDSQSKKQSVCWCTERIIMVCRASENADLQLYQKRSGDQHRIVRL